MARRPGRKAIFGASLTAPPPAGRSGITERAVAPPRLRDRLAALAEEIDALAAQVAKLNQRKLGRHR